MMRQNILFRVNSSGDVIMETSVGNDLIIRIDNVGIGTSPSRVLHTRAVGNVFRMDRGDANVPFVILAGYTNSSYGTIKQVWGFGGGDTENFQISDMGLSVGGFGTPKLVVLPTTGYIGLGGEVAPETLTEWTHTSPYLTLHNSTHEDSDGGRESRLNFKGEKADTTEHTLARIEISHDGSADDYGGSGYLAPILKL